MFEQALYPQHTLQLDEVWQAVVVSRLDGFSECASVNQIYVMARRQWMLIECGCIEGIFSREEAVRKGEDIAWQWYSDQRSEAPSD